MTIKSSSTTDICWQPNDKRSAEAYVTKFIKILEQKHHSKLTSFQSLYEFSIANNELFWREFYKFSGIISDGSPEEVTSPTNGPTPLSKAWFPKIKLNFAENLLRRFRDLKDSPAIHFWGEDKIRYSLTFADLYSSATGVAEFLKDSGIKAGDRVAALVPNIPGAVCCMLGAAAIGAVWSSCGSDYQEEGALQRFSQISPRILVCADSYLHKGKKVSLLETVKAIVSKIPSIEKVVVISYNREKLDVGKLSSELGRTTVEFSSLRNDALKPFPFERVGFSHPLYIMFSSGTTGKPKCIVHSTGGTLVEHLKELMLHTDLRERETIFYHTSCSWMMWNWVVSSLSVGASLVLYDGNPLLDDGAILWKMAKTENVSVFGTSAAYLQALEGAGFDAKKSGVDISGIRALLSTGSPLYPPQFDYIRNSLGEHLQISSISGGTDILGCFGLGAPTLPVYKGQMQSRSLGLKVEIYNEAGKPVVDEVGELVCTASFPNMPVFFWNDSDGALYRTAYFERFPGVWTHGDFAVLSNEGGLKILGRSDATIKASGVRIGTADIYTALQAIKQIRYGLAVGYQPGANEVERIVLFVVLNEGHALGEDLKTEIRNALRKVHAFCVPWAIIEAPDIPRTTNNKVAELAVKRLLHGQEVTNRTALQNPECLEFYAGEARENLKRL